MHLAMHFKRILLPPTLVVNFPAHPNRSLPILITVPVVSFFVLKKEYVRNRDKEIWLVVHIAMVQVDKPGSEGKTAPINEHQAIVFVSGRSSLAYNTVKCFMQHTSCIHIKHAIGISHRGYIFAGCEIWSVLPEAVSVFMARWRESNILRCIQTTSRNNVVALECTQGGTLAPNVKQF